MPGKTVLIVDDIDLVRSIFASFVKAEGHRAVEASRGEEALRMIQEGGVDLVILDIMMPDIDGIEVVSRVRKRRAARDLPVVVVSALDDEAIFDRAIEAGANEFRRKPFTEADLRTILRKYLGAPEAPPGTVETRQDRSRRSLRRQSTVDS